VGRVPYCASSMTDRARLEELASLYGVAEEW
jgi:hypothetical protein